MLPSGRILFSHPFWQAAASLLFLQVLHRFSAFYRLQRINPFSHRAMALNGVYMIKYLAFDCSDTLLRFFVLDELAKRTGDHAQAQKIKASIHQSPAWCLYDKGLISEEGLREEILPLFHAEERSMAAWYLDHWVECYFPIPGMLELVSELHEKGWPLYLISDFPPRFEELANRFPALFHLFSGCSVSFQCHAIKRDKGLFTHFLQQFNRKAEECLFIDDIPRNVDNARSLGFQGIVFENADQLRSRLLSLGIL